MTKKSRFVIEDRYKNSNSRNHAYVIETKTAARWLIENDHVLPENCKQFDKRENLDETVAPGDESRIVNYCLNCIRMGRSRLPLSRLEVEIMEALGSSTLIGRSIAEKAGLPFNSNFRAALARLVATQFLLNVRGEGYRANLAMS